MHLVLIVIVIVIFILMKSGIGGQAHGPAPTRNAEKVASVCHPEQSEGSKQCT
jgi:hypothetical protein